LRAVGDRLTAAAELLGGCWRQGHRVYVCGNGGSAADAEHIVGELMKSMAQPRPLPPLERAALEDGAPPQFSDDAAYLAAHLEGSLPAVCLSSQSSLLTAVANDQGADLVFAQQVHGYGRPGDVLWALSTSGRSRNVVLAALAARARAMPVLAMTGRGKGPLGELAQVWVPVPATDVGDVQELHRPVYHALCRALEEAFFPAAGETTDAGGADGGR
jgi:D-sedoheptulose 7-phosphate isomerase